MYVYIIYNNSLTATFTAQRALLLPVQSVKCCSVEALSCVGIRKYCYDVNKNNKKKADLYIHFIYQCYILIDIFFRHNRLPYFDVAFLRNVRNSNPILVLLIFNFCRLLPLMLIIKLIYSHTLVH